MGQIQILEIRSGSKPVAAVCRGTVPILLRRRLSQAALGDLLCRSRRIRMAGAKRGNGGMPVREANVAAGRYAEGYIRKKRSCDRFWLGCQPCFVNPLGLEPRTPTLKVLCSTCWASESNLRCIHFLIAIAKVYVLVETTKYYSYFFWIIFLLFCYCPDYQLLFVLIKNQDLFVGYTFGNMKAGAWCKEVR